MWEAFWPSTETRVAACAVYPAFAHQPARLSTDFQGACSRSIPIYSWVRRKVLKGGRFFVYVKDFPMINVDLRGFISTSSSLTIALFVARIDLEAGLWKPSVFPAPSPGPHAKLNSVLVSEVASFFFYAPTRKLRYRDFG